ncbi:MAG TPA: transporter substrate-binding domain-containing protein [Desulfobulbus sp.]|nr:transporter substrate-binding domain-containing protein [Desulfobulbus sp.]
MVSMNIYTGMAGIQRIICIFFVVLAMALPVGAEDLDTVLQSGTLQHLGIPYANFITPDRQGLDVDLMHAFADYLGVRYKFIESTWSTIIPDLTGKKIKVEGDNVSITGRTKKKGNVIATGFTVLPWREKIVSFSQETFPSGIWLISRNDSRLTPIKPTGDIHNDIAMVKKELAGVSVLGLQGSCLAPSLYGIDKTGAQLRFFPPGNDLEEMIPSVIAHNADATLIDVPVAQVALTRWPGKIKVIGPVSPPQKMACAFARDSPKLKAKFDVFFHQFKKSGQYRKLVEKYYPSVFTYYPNFAGQERP